MAQLNANDSIKNIELEEVIIYENKLKSAEVGLNVIVVDSLILEQSRANTLAELFGSAGIGQIRSNGPGGVSSPAFRGLGSSHTAILWNGISITSPLLGQEDLSAIPVAFVNDIQLQKGGAGSIYGSGAIGGSIQLNNKTYFNKGLSLSSDQILGSFGKYYQGYSVKWSSKRLSSSTTFFNKKIENNFPYLNRNVLPARKESREHSAVHQRGFLHQNDFRIDKSQLIGIKVWAQKNALDVPNPITKTKGVATQNDQFVRAMLSWNYDKQDFGISYTQAFLVHQSDFVDTLVSINSRSVYQSWISRVESTIDLSKTNQLIVGISNTFDISSVNSFGALSPERNNTAVYGSFKLKSNNEKLLLALNIREELIDGQAQAISPFLGTNFDMFDWLKLKANVSKNYRNPTFNDLYWKGAGAVGNPTLDTETSWNEELGFELKSSKKNPVIFSSTIFNSLVNNWVQWVELNPADILWTNVQQKSWTPINIKQVWSRGIESDVLGSYQLFPVNIIWRVSYSYTKTSNQKISSEQNQSTLNNQLVYTPLHKANLYVNLDYKNFAWSTYLSIVGKQYSDADNNELRAIPAYQLLNATLSKKLFFESFQGSIQFDINNILNTSYENRRGYPTYGRNYSLGLTIQFKNKTNHD